MSDHKDYWTDEHVEGLNKEIESLKAQLKSIRNSTIDECISKVNGAPGHGWYERKLNALKTPD